VETRPFAPEIWVQLPPEVQAYIWVLENALRQSFEKIAQLEQRVNELEARLNRNSNNSSQPPSQDPPQAPKKIKREKSGRPPGGQPGHEGNHRKFVSTEKVDNFLVHRVEACPHCHSFLQESMGRRITPVERHQVWELPEFHPIVTEHRLVASWCPQCQQWVKPDLPAEVGRSAFGPRLQAWVAILTGRFRLSRRLVGELLQELCDVSVSLGSIQTLCEETSEALAAPYQEAKEAVAQADMAHLDETGWKEKGKKFWLWVAVTRVVTVFMVSCTRSQKALKELIGESFPGIVHSDRWGVYNIVDTIQRQICWAHLKRDFQAMSERETRAGPLGEWGLREIKRLFDIWHRYQDGKISWAVMRWELVPVRTRLGRLLRLGSRCGDPKAEAMCRNLLKLWPALLTFAFVPGVEPTNNRAERALRAAVLWRKGCFGNQSENGSRFTERILTAVATLRQQNRNVVDYVVAAIQAHRTGQIAPSLLPVNPLLAEAA
jgi:transposase